MRNAVGERGKVFQRLGVENSCSLLATGIALGARTF